MPLDQGLTPTVLRLAEWMADPAAWHPETEALAADLRADLAQSAVLRPRLNDWLAGIAGLAALNWDDSVLSAVEAQPEAELSVALLTEPEDRLLDIARFLGAALWADRLRRTVLRTDRDRLAEQLGAEAMAFGLRRAPVLAKALMETPLAQRASDPVAAGYALAGALVARTHPALFDLWRLRFPASSEAAALTERQAQAAWAILALRGTMA